MLLLLRRCQAAFDVADLDGDGMLTRSELREANSELACKERKQRVCKTGLGSTDCADARRATAEACPAARNRTDKDHTEAQVLVSWWGDWERTGAEYFAITPRTSIDVERSEGIEPWLVLAACHVEVGYVDVPRWP